MLQLLQILVLLLLLQLELWCNDVHYQAVVDARRIVLSDKASTSRGYREGNWVNAREVTLSVVNSVEEVA